MRKRILETWPWWLLAVAVLLIFSAGGCSRTVTRWREVKVPEIVHVPGPPAPAKPLATPVQPKTAEEIAAAIKKAHPGKPVDRWEVLALWIADQVRAFREADQIIDAYNAWAAEPPPG